MGIWRMDTTVEAWRFAGLLGERGWIVESRNDADYMDRRKIVKARRRQVRFNLPFVACFYAPITYGWNRMHPSADGKS